MERHKRQGQDCIAWSEVYMRLGIGKDKVGRYLTEFQFRLLLQRELERGNPVVIQFLLSEYFN